MPHIKIERLLVATDFSKAGQRAVDVAAEWARATGAQLRIVHVTPPKGWLTGAWHLKSSVAHTIQQHAGTALKRAADLADPARALELSTGVLSGPAARSIARAAQEYGADLLVVGARGEHDEDGEPALGGTSAKLLDTVKTPLLLVREARKDPAGGVVAALDLSPHSKTVLEWADFAAAERHLYACHVYDAPFAARLEAYGLSANAIDVYSEQALAQRDTELATLIQSVARTGVTSRAVERGEPAAAMRRYVERVRPSLVVLGKHVRGRRRSRAGGVGSVCRHVASAFSGNVLVV
ncbi:MAG TPA: universal stress protein [Gammaproteobacteria bacterium]|nr:universal stress protein [Gammaproteobacteria bacterium]